MSYNTCNLAHERSTLLPAELKGQAAIVETQCYHDLESCDGSCRHRYGRRARRSGCCRLLYVFVVSFVLTLGLLHMARHFTNGTKFFGSWGGNPSSPLADIPQSCSNANIPYRAGELTYSFDLSDKKASNDFLLLQRFVKGSSGFPHKNNVYATGQVVVEEVSSGPDVSVDLDIQLSRAELSDLVHIENSSSALKIKSEQWASVAELDACIYINAKVRVARSANLSALTVDTVTLDTLLADGLTIKAKNLKVASVAGRVQSDSTSLAARKIEIITVAGDISGSYPLADLLSLKTTAGQINVDVDPKDAAPGKGNVTATLLVQSTAGAISVDTKSDSVPDRKYKTTITGASGSISGNLPLGLSTTITSAAGSISATLFTAGTAQNRTLTSQSTSGNVDITVDDSKYELGTLRSNMGSSSGSITATLPAAWEGTIKGESVIGTVEVSGSDIKIIKDVKATPVGGRILVATRGDGDSLFQGEVTTGTVDVTVA